MPNKLGVFVDTDSINWVLVDANSNKLLDLGAHIFPKGCQNFGSGKHEVSKKHNRRLLRLKRIRYARIRKRKYVLLRKLISLGMCPLTMEQLLCWKKNKQFPREELNEWLNLNPYKLRERGLHEKISLMEFGRIFYQIACHRGYRFGDRNSKLLENTLSKGVPLERKIGFRQTYNSIGEGTLGEYLNSIYPKEGKSYQSSEEKIRNRICAIEMYVDEIHQLWKVQSSFYHSLNDQTRDQLIGPPDAEDPSGILFFQRPLKSQKHKVGNCIYEHQKTRCCVSALIFQEMEAWKWAKSIKVNSQSLASKDVIKAVDFYLRHHRFVFSDVKKVLGLKDSQNFNYKDGDKIKGSFINAEMSKKKYFGSDWFSMDEKIKEDIFHALYFFTSRQRLKAYAEDKLYFSETTADQFSNIHIDKNYTSISKKACRNILYFLKQGFAYKTAVYLAGIRNALRSQWDAFDQYRQVEIISLAIRLHTDMPSSKLVLALKEKFKTELGIHQLDTRKLYGLAQPNTSHNKQRDLPAGKNNDRKIDQIKNALLVQSAFELRKVINGVIKDHGPITHISCELSVDLKINRMQRYIFKVDQKRIQKNEDRYMEVLKDRGVDLIPNNFLKFYLWEECKQTCPYSGKAIEIDQLFTAEIQIVYIHPWSRSMSDSRLNKTLCIAEIADQLKERTPYEFFEETGHQNWENVKTRCAKLFSSSHYHPASYNKFKRFVKKYNQRDILKKQLNDPHQSSRVINELLLQVCDSIAVVPGNTTQHFIDEWLLINVFSNRSNHKDYRGNILRAYVNAIFNREHISHLAKRNKYKRQEKRVKFPVPYDDYFEDLKQKIHEVFISHKQSLNIVSSRSRWYMSKQGKKQTKVKATRGPLHKETYYGKRTAPPLMNEALHVRKPLRMIKTPTQVSKIVDPEIRKIIEKHVNKNAPKMLIFPSSLFFETKGEKFPIPKIYLPNKKGDPVPIYNVRIRELMSNPIQIKKGKNCYVVSRNNHHISVYESADGVLKEDVVTFWTVSNRYRQNKEIYKDYKNEGGKLITHMHINDLFLMGIDQDVKLENLSKETIFNHLYRVQKLSGCYYEFRIAYKQNNSRTDFPEYIRITNFGQRRTGWKTYQPRKIKLSVTGKILSSA